MLIKANWKDGRKSIYKCDRCDKEISKKDDNFYGLFIKKSNEGIARKKCDLCDRCYRALIRGINKKKGETNE